MEHTQKHRRKMPSFSSSLLDAIYHSTDDPIGGINGPKEPEDFKKNNAGEVEREIESLRRAIRIEKWIERHTNTSTRRYISSNSDSSTDSSLFSSSETESSGPIQPGLSLRVQTERPEKVSQPETTPLKRQSRFTRTKSRALKIYGDLKRVREPISPGGKIVNFFNSIFSPRNMKRNLAAEEWGGPVRKSRSMKDTTSSSSSLAATRSCLSINPNKSKRSVRFCHVGVVSDEDDRCTGSRSATKNTGSLRRCGFVRDQSCEDDASCASSDLFELENIGRVYEEELPVYGTTNVMMNQAIIASGLMM